MKQQLNDFGLKKRQFLNISMSHKPLLKLADLALDLPDLCLDEGVVVGLELFFLVEVGR